MEEKKSQSQKQKQFPIIRITINNKDQRINRLSISQGQEKRKTVRKEENNPLMKNELHIPRRSLNIRINQRFNIKVSPSNKKERDNKKQTNSLRKILENKVNLKKEQSEISKRSSRLQERIDKSLSNYYSRKESRKSDNFSPMKSLILKDSLREKKRRERTDKKLKVIKY